LPVISIGSYLRGANQLSRGAELDLTFQFTRADAMVAWQFGESHWKLQLNVKDLTNHRYYETDAITMYLYRLWCKRHRNQR